MEIDLSILDRTRTLREYQAVRERRGDQTVEEERRGVQEGMSDGRGRERRSDSRRGGEVRQ